MLEVVLDDGRQDVPVLLVVAHAALLVGVLEEPGIVQVVHDAVGMGHRIVNQFALRGAASLAGQNDAPVEEVCLVLLVGEAAVVCVVEELVLLECLAGERQVLDVPESVGVEHQGGWRELLATLVGDALAQGTRCEHCVVGVLGVVLDGVGAHREPELPVLERALVGKRAKGWAQRLERAFFACTGVDPREDHGVHEGGLRVAAEDVVQRLELPQVHEVVHDVGADDGVGLAQHVFEHHDVVAAHVDDR